ncbi:hypothetical protein [Chromobacterium rhizoryzae]|uniref:hypothetical protein n=1 Tax=Chromobacterium rhizoryzae TaxID=1778675 RepID=UPI0013C324CC|nr:hypothetical protein [Chromobacterium rhizoryzae]
MTPNDVRDLFAASLNHAGLQERRLYAKELRLMGYDIQASIPDCAWVNFKSVKFSVGEVYGDSAGRSVNFTLSAEFTDPFRWVSVPLLPPDEPDCFTAHVAELPTRGE